MFSSARLASCSACRACELESSASPEEKEEAEVIAHWNRDLQALPFTWRAPDSPPASTEILPLKLSSIVQLADFTYLSVCLSGRLLLWLFAGKNFLSTVNILYLIRECCGFQEATTDDY